jgi:hypothetical protein
MAQSKAAPEPRPSCPQVEAGAIMTPEQAVAFVQMHGVVLESTKGAVPSLVQAIVGRRG